MDGVPGFTEEAFKVLENKAHNYKERNLGMVNFGAGPIIGEDEDTTANQALVFMLIPSMKIGNSQLGTF